MRVIKGGGTWKTTEVFRRWERGMGEQPNISLWDPLLDQLRQKSKEIIVNPDFRQMNNFGEVLISPG
jgi:hypothetical protein